MSVCISKKDKEILLDSYRKLFGSYFKHYQEMVSRGDLFGNEKRYEECNSYCSMCNNELRGMVLLFEDAGVLDRKESSEELGKIKKVFNSLDLIDLCFGKEEV